MLLTNNVGRCCICLTGAVTGRTARNSRSDSLMSLFVCLFVCFCLSQVHHNEFIPMFEQQYPDHKWVDVEVNAYFDILNEAEL